ncbi:winged helix-turn-helix transcriptional regulator [Agrobacterium vitis]|uniref:ArsR/SmtB family transcription factor n=1 Tax=Allorhizobium ampelinum TaxID=3025782 RepID=UPI001F1699DB|nr:metalloregulator ArsR/SmtB family transcription factor [Allorhizobium ampelinum]MCF1449828.1 winged helix-turn-helix transcriptional regulator [Allorhizobium ampelinum]
MKTVEDAAGLLSAMANPKRLQMLLLLANKELSAGELTKLVDLDQSAASQHLAKLRAAALVETRRQAQQIFYRCRVEKVQSVLTTLESIYMAK